jgi:hypothetical protein
MTARHDAIRAVNVHPGDEAQALAQMRKLGATFFTPAGYSAALHSPHR